MRNADLVVKVDRLQMLFRVAAAPCRASIVLHGIGPLGWVGDRRQPLSELRVKAGTVLDRISLEALELDEFCPTMNSSIEKSDNVGEADVSSLMSFSLRLFWLMLVGTSATGRPLFASRLMLATEFGICPFPY